eukprot:TRINITY_DN5196_c0_g1_i1.p1 TRINITY_DN5196_c0_g1~~TRINITY_DN5196_c0_g1_i1.p1  ORF type:complete len:161 (-),score=40.34 TRINITY_DN5196_c0_g1_i1:82-564(-)
MNNGEAITRAVEFNQPECVELLLLDGRSNLGKSAAITLALTTQNTELIFLLLEHPEANLENIGGFNFFIAAELTSYPERRKVLEVFYSHPVLRETLRTKGLIKENEEAPVDEGLDRFLEYFEESHMEEEETWWNVVITSGVVAAAAIGVFYFWKWRSNKD